MQIIPQDLGYIDILVILFMLWGLFEGFVKGFSVQVSRFIAMVLGITAGLILYEPFAKSLAAQTLVNEFILGSLILFFTSTILAFILRVLFAVIGKIVSFQFVYFIERILGSLLGGIRYILYFCFLKVSNQL